MDVRLLHIYFGPMSVCLSIPNFIFVYIDFIISKLDFGMLTLTAS